MAGGTANNLRPADCLAKGGQRAVVRDQASDVLSDRDSTLDFVAQFPLLKPLDMSDAICRADVCRPVEGNVLIYHGAHHLSPTYMRTMVPELGRQIGGEHRLVVRTRPRQLRPRIQV